jgi:hypothetical protein
MPMTELLTRTGLYEQDFVLWLEHQAALLRAGRLEEVDARNVAEELEAMARNEHRELRSRLRILIIHLLKWDHQPQRRSGSWMRTVLTQQSELQDLLATSPSLRRLLPAAAQAVFPSAVRRAAFETGLPPARFPPALPYDIEAVLRQEDPFAQPTSER